MNVSRTALVLLGLLAVLVVAAGRESVRNGDYAADHAFHEQLSKTLDEGQATGFSSAYVVPEGKRLVLEYVSFFGNTRPGQKVHVTIKAGFMNDHPVLVSCIGCIGGCEQHRAAQPVKVYVDAGETIEFFVERVGGTGGLLQSALTLSGYLADVP